MAIQMCVLNAMQEYPLQRLQLLDLALLLKTLFLVGNPFVLLAALSAAAGAAGVNFLTPIFPSVITNCDG